MQKIKIGIVEDELIIADSLSAVLTSLGYEVAEPCINYTEAISMLETETPDIVLLDIVLKQSKSGIEVARYIRENLDIPFIFITANSDPETVQQAKTVSPNAFLVKPFQKADIYAAIEIAMNNFKPSSGNAAAAKQTAPLAAGVIFIKEGHYFHKVNFDDIVYLNSENVYVIIHTAERKYMVRATLQEYLEKFDPAKFIRVHQSYAVNIAMVEKINSTCLTVGNTEIPVSRSYHKYLLANLNIG